MDETQPLLGSTYNGDLERVHSKDDFKNNRIVDFDPNGDAENPIDWSKTYKRGIVALLAFMAFTVSVSPRDSCANILTGS